MSKALVIRGANFLANRVEQIEIMEPVPCTGLSVSPATVSFTALNATQQLTATKTPADTTDTLNYISSNESVATVSNTGVVTCVGIGTATITVTCGTIVAQCAVESTLTVIADDVWYTEHGAKYSGSMALPTKNHIGRTTGENSRLFYSSDNVLGGYRVFVSTINDGKYAIPLPNGATKVTITVPSDVSKYHVQFVLADTTQKQTYVTGADGNSALGIYAYVKNSQTESSTTFDFSEYAEAANGFICSLEFVTPSTDAAVGGKITLKFE